MKNLKALLLPLLLICFFLSSCKAYRNLENLNPKSSEEERAGDFDISSLNKLVEGDRIILITIDGVKHNLIYKRIDGDQILGTTINNGLNKSQITEDIIFAIADIEKVWVKRVSAAATAPVAVLGALGILFGIYAIGVSSGSGYL